MTAVLRMAHKDFCSDYGEHVIGSLEQMHPLAAQMIEECAAHRTGDNSRYMEFMRVFAEDMAQRGTPIPIEKLKEAVTPEKFAEFMKAFALGMQFAARKVGGKVHVDAFEFHHTVKMGGKEIREFPALACVTEDNIHLIMIDPVTVAGMIQMQHARSPHSPKGNDINPKEELTLLGVEEMMHHFQIHQGKRPTYNGANYTDKEREDDPMEQEAEVLRQVAMQELRLGSKYRGRKV